jgi:hypothetical protein
MIPNKVYDILKWIALVFLPALGTFLFTLSTIYGWGWGETAVGTIAAVDTFLGALLGISTIKYNKDKESE